MTEHRVALIVGIIWFGVAVVWWALTKWGKSK